MACQGQSFSGRSSAPYLAALSVGSPNVCGACSWASGNRFLGGLAENGTLKEKLPGLLQSDTVILSPYCDFFNIWDVFTFLSDWSNGNIATKKHQLPPRTKISAYINGCALLYLNIYDCIIVIMIIIVIVIIVHSSIQILAWVCSLYLTEMITEMFVYYRLLILPVLLYFAGNAFETNS